MQTVIDSLVVVLKLDPKDWDKGQQKVTVDLRKMKDEVRRGGKEFDAWGKQSAQSIQQVSNAALRLLAVFTAGMGIKNFAIEQTKLGAATGRLAYNMGAATKEVSEWWSAVELLGGNGDAAAQSMFGLSQSIQEFALTGQSSIVPYLRSIGVALTDEQGHIRSISDIYLDLADKLSKMSPQQANFIGRAIGLDQGTINLLERGRNAVQGYLDAARVAGNINNEQAAKLQNLETAWTKFGKTATSVGRDVLTDVAPSISSGLDMISAAIVRNQKAVENAAKAGGAGAIIGAIIGGVLGAPGGPLGIAAGAAAGASIGGVAAGGIALGAQAMGGLTGAAGITNPASSIIIDPYSGAAVPNSTPDSVYRMGSTIPIAPAGLTLFDLIQKLERSGARSVSPKGARGRNQIMPSTAAQYGFDPAKLDDPAYNDMVARAIEGDLARRYHGDLDAIAIAYNAGPMAADRWLRSGRNSASLPAETRAYLAREQSMVAGAGGPTQVHIGEINIDTRATDANGIARDIHSAIRDQALVTQGNQGPQ